MAVWNGRPNTSDVLRAADTWRRKCLIADGSVFSDDHLWTLENLAEFDRLFRSNPLLGTERFIDKLEKQLELAPKEVKRLAAECLWLLLLFVSDGQMRPPAKREYIEQILSTAGCDLPFNDLTSDEALSGIGRPGAAFMTKMPGELGCLLSILIQYKSLAPAEQGWAIATPWSMGEWVDKVDGAARRPFRHMFLFLMFPDSYERISSSGHKRRILKAYEAKLQLGDGVPRGADLLDIDRGLLALRGQLENQLGKTEIDFYLPPLSETWREASEPEGDAADLEAPVARSVWIEKTIAAGRVDREFGPHALGKALWSPQRSQDGRDIYSSMRRVRPGDLVLHLTDNTALSGVSIAAAQADDTFVGLSGTDWAGAPGYRIALQHHTKLDPPLPRDAFLKTAPFDAELRELVASGARGQFFNSNLELNQGAYLTECTPTLLSILARAYRTYAGKDLPFVEIDADATIKAAVERPFVIEDALDGLFLDRNEVADILLLWRAKKNIVLQGPPGVGKSFAAQRIANALMGARDKSRVGFVQFHQSYSYEDFVEGFRPTGDGFELQPGKFVKFCREAEADPNNAYVFIIDEINRGNLSKILGELMLLIESDKRDPSWAISLASGSVPFFVPANVFLIGLMNTADRSLAVVDYALRRRFAFVDLEPKLGSRVFQEHVQRLGVDAQHVDALVRRIESLNSEIIADVTNLGSGFAIGHSFFCGGPVSDEDGPSWYSRIIRTEILPLLREYWFDAPARVREWEERLLAPL